MKTHEFELTIKEGDEFIIEEDAGGVTATLKLRIEDTGMYRLGNRPLGVESQNPNAMVHAHIAYIQRLLTNKHQSRKRKVA